MYITKRPENFDTYNVGDRVRYIYANGISRDEPLIGMEGIITDTRPNPYNTQLCVVEFDNHSHRIFYAWKLEPATPKASSFNLPDELFEVDEEYVDVISDTSDPDIFKPTMIMAFNVWKELYQLQLWKNKAGNVEWRKIEEIGATERKYNITRSS